MQSLEKQLFGSLADLFPEGTKIHMMPKLPTIELKRGKAKYDISDVRLLHPAGVQTLLEIINIVAETQDTRISFAVPLDVDEETIDVVADIVMGYSVNAHYRDGDYESGCIVTGCDRAEHENGGRGITFHVVKDFAEFIHARAEKREGQTLNLVELMMDYADEQYENMKKWLEEHNDGAKGNTNNPPGA